jgi:hypothetical protein
MFRRNLLFALAFVAAIFWFSQEAYACCWDLEPDFWGMGSDQVVANCFGGGRVETGGQTADVNVDGTCNFTLPAVKSNVPCNFHITYKFPAPPPLVQQPNGSFLQDWTAACNLKDLIVDGDFTCDDGAGFTIHDNLGLSQKKNQVTSNICEKVFGTANAPVLQAQVFFDTNDPQNRKVFDLSQATNVKCCHADQNDPLALVSCIDGKDIQQCSSAGTNITRAFCSYSEPIQDNCSAPDSGVFTARLHANAPANAADPLAISISLDSVNEGTIRVNNQMPVPNGACKPGTFQGKDVIDCKFNSCDANGNFIFPEGIAILTATRDNSGTAIQCVNTLQLR